MAAAGRLCAALLCGALSLCGVRAAARQPDTLYLWIDAQQARVLIGKRAGGREGGREGERWGSRSRAAPRIAPSALRRLRGGHPDRVRGEDGPVHSRLQESSAEDAGHPRRHPRHELQLASYGTGRCGRGHLQRRARGRAVRPDGALRGGDGPGAAVPAGRLWAPSVGVRALSAGRPPLSARSRCAPNRGCR